MKNIPVVKLGIVAVSRDCFPMELSASRRSAVVNAYEEAGGEIFECPTTVENEKDLLKRYLIKPDKRKVGEFDRFLYDWATK